MPGLKMRWKAIVSASVALIVVTVIGVLFFFGPISESDTTAGPLPHPLIAFSTYIVLSIALYDWLVRQIRHPYKAAFVIAAAQYVLVIDLTLRGERGWTTAAASGALLIATWASVAFAYSRFSSKDPR